MPELTPVMKQYHSIKERYKDAIVFFRLGDFYEMFGEDAEKASKILQMKGWSNAAADLASRRNLTRIF